MLVIICGELRADYNEAGFLSANTVELWQMDSIKHNQSSSRLDGDSGSNAFWLMLYDNNGDYCPSVDSLVDGRFGQAVSFAANADLDEDDCPNLWAKTRTKSAWKNWPDVRAGLWVRFSDFDDVQTLVMTDSWRIWTQGSTLRFTVGFDDGTSSGNRDISLDGHLNEWLYVSAEFDKSGAQILSVKDIDGGFNKSVSEIFAGKTLGETSGYITFASENGKRRSFSGEIDSVRISRSGSEPEPAAAQTRTEGIPAPLASTLTKQQRCNQVLNNFYREYKFSSKLGRDIRRTMCTVLAGLTLNLSEDDNQRCNEAIVQLLHNKKSDFSSGTQASTLYWALPKMCMLLTSPDLSTRLTPEAVDVLKAVLWDFVYTYDDFLRADCLPEDLLTVYGSDNHDLHKKCVFLMASQIFKNDPAYADRDYIDGSTAQNHYDALVKYLMEYYRYRAQRGIDIEFGSAIYSGVHLQPLFAIYDGAEDEQLREYTRRFIDLYFADVAQETIGGIRGGAKVRMYKDPFTYKGSNDRMMFCSYMLAGQPEILPGPPSFGSLTVAASHYELPDMIRELMIQPERRGHYSYITRRLGQGDHTLYKQHGYGNDKTPMYIVEFPSAVYRYSWCTPHYVLGWFAIDESEHYMLINSQSQWMGLITGENVDSRIVFQTTDPKQLNRISYRGLMAIGDQHAMIVRKQIAAADRELLMTYVSDDFSLEEDAVTGWIFGRNSQVFYAMKPAQVDSDAPDGIDVSSEPKYRIETNEGFAGQFIKYLDPGVMIVFETASVDDYPDFESFKEDMRDNTMCYINNFDEFEYYPSRSAAKLTMFADLKTPKINDELLVYFPDDTYKSPYISGKRNSSLITLTGLDGNSMTLNFDY